MSDQAEDFAAMFEASIQAKRLDQGELVEGRIVAIGPEVALVDVGRKGEAVMDIAELKNADGEIEVALGDLVQAMVVSTSGGLTLSRRLAGAAASDQQFEAAFQSGLPVEGKVEREVKGGYEVRIGRRRAFCPISQIDLRGADAVGARRACLPIPHHRVQGRRREHRRLPARAPRGRAAGERRQGPRQDRPRRRHDRPCRLRPRVRRVRRSRRRCPGAAPRVRDGVVPRVEPCGDRQSGRGDHGQGPARGRGKAEDIARVEAALRRPLVESAPRCTK